MSSDEQKRQLLAQKLFRSLKSKHKSVNHDQKTVILKKAHTTTAKRDQEIEVNLIK